MTCENTAVGCGPGSGSWAEIRTTLDEDWVYPRVGGTPCVQARARQANKSVSLKLSVQLCAAAWHRLLHGTGWHGHRLTCGSSAKSSKSLSICSRLLFCTHTHFKMNPQTLVARQTQARPKVTGLGPEGRSSAGISHKALPDAIRPCLQVFHTRLCHTIKLTWRYFSCTTSDESCRTSTDVSSPSFFTPRIRPPACRQVHVSQAGVVL